MFRCPFQSSLLWYRTGLQHLAREQAESPQLQRCLQPICQPSLALLSLAHPWTQRTWGPYSHRFHHSLQTPAEPLSWLYTPYICENRGKEHFLTFAIYYEKFKRRVISSCHTLFFPLSVHTTRREEIWVLDIWNTLGRNRFNGKIISPFPQSRSVVWRHELLPITPSQLHSWVTSAHSTKETSYFCEVALSGSTHASNFTTPRLRLSIPL